MRESNLHITFQSCFSLQTLFRLVWFSGHHLRSKTNNYHRGQSHCHSDLILVFDAFRFKDFSKNNQINMNISAYDSKIRTGHKSYTFFFYNQRDQVRYDASAYKLGKSNVRFVNINLNIFCHSKRTFRFNFSLYM